MDKSNSMIRPLRKVFVPFVIALLTMTPRDTECKHVDQAPADDFDIIKSRVVAELMKTDVDDNRVEKILGRMKPDGSFQDINYDDLSRTAGFPHRMHTADLVYLAKAYKNKKSKFYKSKKA